MTQTESDLRTLVRCHYWMHPAWEGSKKLKQCVCDGTGWSEEGRRLVKKIIDTWDNYPCNLTRGKGGILDAARKLKELMNNER